MIQSLESSIALANGEPLFHAVKSASHEWWLAYPSQRWEDILPQESVTTSYSHLSHTIFSRWYKDFINGVHGSHDAHGNWLDFIGPLLYQDAEVKLFEQLVDDIYKRLDKDLISHVRQTTSGASSSTQNSASGSTNTSPASSQPVRVTAKRCHRDDSEPGDKSNDDGPTKATRRKVGRRMRVSTVGTRSAPNLLQVRIQHVQFASSEH